MKIKVKKHAEYLLIGLCYLEHLLKHNQNFNESIIAKTDEPISAPLITDYKVVKLIKSMLATALEIPPMSFSVPMSYVSYYRSCIINIKKIQESYLESKNNQLTSEEKQQILLALKEFYKNQSHRLIFNFSSFTATKHDKIGQFVLLMFFTVIMAHVLQPLINKITTGSTDSIVEDYDEINFDELFEIMLSDNWLGGKVMLTDKELSTKSIVLIYDELATLLPNISKHRRHILTGYVSYGFGLISLEKDKLYLSGYKSFNNFLENRVRKVVENRNKKL